MGAKVVESAESFKIMIYADALKNVMTLPEWNLFFPQK
jgi:hypothetical protein